MQRDESAANPPSADRGDDVNPNTGTGTSGPGDAAYEDESQTGDVGGEAAIDLEEKARRMAAGEAGADPGAAAPSDGAPPEPNPDVVSDHPEVQTGG